jgi:RNA polymerase-binding protein DksA
MIKDLDLQEIRRKLEAELARLQEHMDGGSTDDEQRAGKNLDRDDLAHNFALREREHALRDFETSQLVQIKAALERITSGDYGSCASCGEAIASERLEIIPYAALCIRCQQAQDRV